MTASSPLPAPNLMPLMRYRDLAEAMGWLEQAFGFEKQIAVSDSDGSVIYGQMTYRGSLMMMGAVRDTDLDKLMRQPDEIGGVETQSCYLVVDDADQHYGRAQDAGAEIVLELKSDGLGRRGYSCRDPEGHIWSFGTYNPGKGLSMPAPIPVADVAETPRRSPRMLMGLAVLALAVGAAGLWFGRDIGADISSRIATYSDHKAAQEAEKAYAELVKVRAEKRKADETAAAATKALEAERARRVALESSSSTANDTLAGEQSARRAAEAEAASLREELNRKQQALDAAIEAKRVSEEKLAVKSASVEPSKAAEPQVPKADPPAASGPSGIETSATRPMSREENPAAATSVAADDEPEISRGIGPRRSKAISMRRKMSLRPKPPLYVLDLRHTWPYSGWTQ